MSAMVCPMRIVVFGASMLLIVVASLYLLSGSEASFLPFKASRTWWGFIVSLFTGELVYEAWYGPGSWSSLPCAKEDAAESLEKEIKADDLKAE